MDNIFTNYKFLSDEPHCANCLIESDKCIKLKLVYIKGTSYSCENCGIIYYFGVTRDGYKLQNIIYKYNNIDISFDHLEVTEIDGSFSDNKMDIYLHHSLINSFLKHKKNKTIDKFIQTIMILT